MFTLSRPTAARLLAALAALAMVSVLTIRTSQAAFTDSTDNTGNSFAVGDVEITDDDAGLALFDVTYNDDTADTVGQTGCLIVTYAGSITLTSDVTLAAAFTDTAGGPGNAGDGLSDNLDVLVEIGAPGATCAAFTTAGTIYTGKMDAYGAAKNTWTPSAADTARAFKFTVTHAGLPNDAQGDSTTAGFTWTAST